MERKNINIARVIHNARLLSTWEVSDCVFYGDCEDMDGVNEIFEEIDEVNAALPKELSLHELPDIYYANKETGIFGVAVCTYTEGHGILKNKDKKRECFETAEDAIKKGYRPCGRCMPDAYKAWRDSL